MLFLETSTCPKWACNSSQMCKYIWRTKWGQNFVRRVFTMYWMWRENFMLKSKQLSTLWSPSIMSQTSYLSILFKNLYAFARWKYTLLRDACRKSLWSTRLYHFVRKESWLNQSLTKLWVILFKHVIFTNRNFVH